MPHATNTSKAERSRIHQEVTLKASATLDSAGIILNADIVFRTEKADRLAEEPI